MKQVPTLDMRRHDSAAIMVNIGDMPQRPSNHVYPWTTHRMVNPTGEGARQPRYPVPLFLHPTPDFLINALPGCISAAHPSRYPQPITVHGDRQQRLREIHPV
ncbi:oxidoreductase [mine drainage metagenome]|uniref:Oxidoreductase n=1 Tax=mine drainage metagenome TaxID=410659 RepID=T0ZRS9_9ZZZZ